jgi:hypothetical protein
MLAAKTFYGWVSREALVDASAFFAILSCHFRYSWFAASIRRFTPRPLHRAMSTRSFDPKTHRIHAPVMLGRFDGDERVRDATLIRYRMQAEKAFRKRNADAFINVARKTITHLGRRSMREMPLYLPRTLVFLDPPSPASSIMDEVLRKAFSKACDAADIPGGHLNNNSGRAISGVRGVGKIYCLRTCGIVMPLLLDNVISVWVDYASVEKSDPHRSPFVLMKEAWYRRGVQTPVLDDEKPENMISLLGHAAKARLSFMLIADEVGHVYTEDTVWTDLHTLANSMHHSLFVSDSSSVLRQLVEGSLGADLFKVYGKRQASLNDTKVTMRRFDPLTTRPQYHAYLKAIRVKPLSDVELTGLHILSNGHVRSIAHILTGKEGGDRKAVQTPLPDEGSFGHTVLNHLFQSVVGSSYDPFKGPTIHVQSMLKQWTSASERRNSSFEHMVVELQEKGILRDVGDGRYTLAHRVTTRPSPDASRTCSSRTRSLTTAPQGSTHVWQRCNSRRLHCDTALCPKP